MGDSVHIAHLTKEASFMAVAQAMSIRLLISVIPEKLINTIEYVEKKCIEIHRSIAELHKFESPLRMLR